MLKAKINSRYIVVAILFYDKIYGDSNTPSDAK